MFTNQHVLIFYTKKSGAGWMDGWMDGWIWVGRSKSWVKDCLQQSKTVFKPLNIYFVN